MQGLNRYFWEYTFHQAVQRTDRPVTTSQARQLRRRVDAQIRALRDSSQAGRSPMEVINGVLSAALPDYEAVDTETFDGYAADFGRYISGPDARLPISPYDLQWSARRVMQEAGSHLRWISGSDIDMDPYLQGDATRLAGYQGALPVYDGADTRARQVGESYTDDDAVGLSRIAPYIVARNYGTVRSHVMAGITGADGRVDRSLSRMRAGDIDRAVAVLQHLLDQGTAFEVVPDMRPGQVKVRLSDTGAQIRIIDTANPQYAGARVYQDGITTYFSTNRLSGGNRAPEAYPVGPADAVALVDFSQGAPVARGDREGMSREGRRAPVGRAAIPATVYARVEGQDGRSHRQQVLAPGAYHSGTGNRAGITAAYKDLPDQAGKLVIRREMTARSLPEFFRDAETAESYLLQAVTAAQVNLLAELDVDALVARAREELERTVGAIDEVEPPEYSGSPEVAAIQRAYWDVLTGARQDLLHPGASEQMYRERLEAVGENPDDASLGNLVYLGDPEEKVRSHAEDVVLELVGTYEALPHDVDGELVDKRFDPVVVAQWMTSDKGPRANQDDLVAALRAAGIPASELLGDGFATTRLKDRVLNFDESTAVRIEDHGSPLIRDCGRVVRESLEQAAIVPGSATIEIDDNGVIRYRAKRQGLRGEIGISTAEGEWISEVTGYIGQVFDRGEHGEIVTRFPSGANQMIVPGYRARVRAQRAGEPDSSVEERTLLTGYEQVLHNEIRRRIATDMLGRRTVVGEPGSLNTMYSHLYGTAHPVDYIEQHSGPRFNDRGELVTGLDGLTRARLATEARRVRYDSDLVRGSGVYQDFRASSAGEDDRDDPANDNGLDAWRITGGRNMAVLSGQDARGVGIPAGYFDQDGMTGSGMNQGAVRYLTAGAVVNADGTITPGDPSTPEGRHAPLMLTDVAKHSAHDPASRQQMMTSTVLQASDVVGTSGVAFMTFGAWNSDDAVVISTEFAQRARIRGANGEMRPLQVGDKISDAHGNKGVVSLIIDRGMDPAEAEQASIEEAVAWFRENPELNVVMSPFSFISRRNAGTALEVMDGEVGDLVDPMTGEVHEGAMGSLSLITTHMAIDRKTRVYDDEEARRGRGRRASAQLAWALHARGADGVLSEFYGHNSGAEANLREHMITMGLDMDADGTMRVIGRRESLDERPDRRLIPLPDLESVRSSGRLREKLVREEFGRSIGTAGGDMLIPFPMTYPTGETLQGAGDGRWRLPVLSARLRAGQEFAGESSVLHDYTQHYREIAVQSMRWLDYEDQITHLDASGERYAQQVRDLRARQREVAARAESSYRSITSDLARRVFEGKHNHVRSSIMSSPLPDSATMVWTPDPRLDVDEVAMGPDTARALRVAQGDTVLVWRDPVLRPEGVAGMRVRVVEGLTGVAVSPATAAQMDGDFDGDAVGIARLHTAAALRDARERLAVSTNVLDSASRDYTSDMQPLNAALTLDTAVAIHKRPELAVERDEILTCANSTARRLRSGEITAEQAQDENRVVTGRISEMLHDAWGEFGSALRFDSPENHLASLKEVCVDTGAKGSVRKLSEYEMNLRAPVSRADQEESMYANAVKAAGTGVAGMFSQRAVRALRQLGRQDVMEALLETTKQVTQAILQAKHSASDAHHRYEMLQGPARALWRGHAIEHKGDGYWRTVYEDGQPVQLEARDWMRQMWRFYTSPEGFGVDVNDRHIKLLGEVLADPSTGLVRNLEEDRDLRGTPMDRLAYGGTWDDWVDLAKEGANLYEGRFASTFAPAATRKALAATERQLIDPALDTTITLDRSQLKTDVLEATSEWSRQRGEGRRSQMAVAAGSRTTAPGLAAVMSGSGLEPRSKAAPVPGGGGAPVLSVTFSSRDSDSGYEMGM